SSSSWSACNNSRDSGDGVCSQTLRNIGRSVAIRHASAAVSTLGGMTRFHLNAMPLSTMKVSPITEVKIIIIKKASSIVFLYCGLLPARGYCQADSIIEKCKRYGPG